jgi:hypothetical protein
MNKSLYKVIAPALFSSLIVPLFATGRNWTDLEKLLDEHFQQMETSFASLSKQFSQFSAQDAITVDATEALVTIKMAGIEKDNLEVMLNDNNDQLTITSPTQKVTIIAHPNSIGIAAQATRQEKMKETKDKKEVVPLVSTASVYQSHFTVRGLPLLEKQTVEYNPQTKDLTVKIPLQPARKGKTVPISMVTPVQPTKEHKETIK